MNKHQMESIAENIFFVMYRKKADLCSFQQTFYGCVVFLASKSSKIVIKFSKEIGRVAKEAASLEQLRQMVSCQIPQIYLFGREAGYDYLVLDWLEGISAHQLPHGTDAAKVFSDNYTDILLELHDHSHPQGFQLSSGRFDSDFKVAFDHWNGDIYKYLMSVASPYSADMKQKFTALWESRSDILSPISDNKSSFIHDDCHIGNVLLDPKTFKVSGLLDPLDSGFKHRELDVFHLFEVRSDLQIGERYIEKYPLAEGFASRRYFFSLWDDARHSRNIGWYNEEWLANKFVLYESTLKE